MLNQEHSRKEFFTTGAALAGAAVLGFNRMAQAEEHEGMITQLATIGINEDKIEEVTAALTELVKAVEENEPGVLAYICHRSAKETDKVVFFEVYKDEATLQAHGQTPHLAKMREHFGAGLLKPPVDIHRLNRIEGFMR